MSEASIKDLDGRATLSLANGCGWTIVPANQLAQPVVDMLSHLMDLQQGNHGGNKLVVEIREKGVQTGRVQGLDVVIDEVTLISMLSGSYGPQSTGLLARPEEVRCILGPVGDDETLALQLHRLSLLFVLYAQDKGGLLLHGALAERSGFGVALVGPSGVGKTTCSRRLPPPWLSLSDDLTLVVRDDEGTYWAHPWPSWGSLAQGMGKGRTWNVEEAVPLKAIFFLEQSPQDNLDNLGNGAALCSLMESVTQATYIMSLGAGAEERRGNHLQQFENACALVEALPAYKLQVSAVGTFWQEMEQVLDLSVPGSS